MQLDTATGLKDIMEAKGISVLEVAEKYGCSRTHIYRLLDSGAKHLHTVEQLSEVLEIKPSEFIKASELK